MTAPSTTIIFCEENDSPSQSTYGETRGDSLCALTRDGPFDPTTARHSGGMNFVMGDGHCEWIRAENYCRGTTCKNQPYGWDDSASDGDWQSIHPPPYHWWFAVNISTAQN